jgi:DNA-binding GntR family transcriptional regulator
MARAPKKKELLVNRALRELEERFVALRLPPGSQWTEASLSEELKIGRTPVREAVARMALDGLLTVVKRAGIVISQVSIEEQLKVLEARRVLERLVSGCAAIRATDVEREELREMSDSIEAAGKRNDVHAYLHHHFQIKRYVAAAARNVYAERALRPLHTLSQRFYFVHHLGLDNLRVVGPAHAQLTRAIAEGDAQLAMRRCDAVSDIAERFTRDLFNAKTRRAA